MNNLHKKQNVKKDVKIKVQGGKKKYVMGKHVVKHAAVVLRMAKELKMRSSLLSDYVKVDTKDSKTSSADLEEIDSLKQQISMLRAVARESIGGERVKLKLFWSTSISGGAGAAIAGFVAMIPSNSIEWASAITLYDEARVDSILLRHIAGPTVLPAASATATCVPYAIGYDPTFNTNPASVEDVQESQYSQLKVFPCSASFPQAVTPVGFHELKVKIPKDGPVVSEDMKAKTNFPGAWMSCLDTADSVGYVRYYVPALGTTSQNAIRIHVEMAVEFRIRT